jgi:hypothetical protein
MTLRVLHHLREIERRRLFSDLKYGSLFEYAVKELGYSESSATRRIQSARLIKDIPEIEKKIEQGKLSLTNVALAAQTFTRGNISDTDLKKEIISQIEDKTKRECEKTLLGFCEPNPLPKEKIKVVSPEYYAVNFNFSEATMQKFEELKALTAHKRKTLDELLRFCFEIAVNKVQKDKYKLNALPRSPEAKPCTNRNIPNFVKKEVYLRDKGRCSKCGSIFKIEFDHVKTFAEGGKHTLSNLRLLCFSCNQRRLKN